MRRRNEKFFLVQKDSIHSTILQIMQKSKNPMSVSEITKKVMTKRKINSETPQKTVSSILSRSTFVRSEKKRGHYSIIKKPIFR